MNPCLGELQKILRSRLLVLDEGVRITKQREELHHLAYDRWIADIERHRGTASILGFSWTQDGLVSCVSYLLETMPEEDLIGEWHEGISLRYLVDNSLWALHVRNSYPWAKEVPQEIFDRWVLTYAVANETRCCWRHVFQEASERCWAMKFNPDNNIESVTLSIVNNICKAFDEPHVRCCAENSSLSVWNTLKDRRASPKALCIFVIYALRAAGIPARALTVTFTHEGQKMYEVLSSHIVFCHGKDAKKRMQNIPRGRLQSDSTHIKDATEEQTNENCNDIVIDVWSCNGWHVFGLSYQALPVVKFEEFLVADDSRLGRAKT